MADIDLPGQFPNSKMAGAAKQGLSRFISIDVAGTLLKSEPVSVSEPVPEQPDVPPLKE